MSGTITGGRKSAITIKAKHGSDFYAKIGAKGGKNGNTGGFATDNTCNCKLKSKFGENHRLARYSGFKGGTISRRTKK